MWSRNRSRSSGINKSNTCLAFGVTRPNKDENGRGGLSGFSREIETVVENFVAGSVMSGVEIGGFGVVGKE
ncbi:hypothetical protein L195_g047206 [Trifolium pratense]|uniref:Uncharacterized protein n=1 Tax=Trifolium pratense TaxID=57577 RepID=A0A2K3MJT3_TRIPR|nr:hypothetical protein L195_g047206 [Trifolium pratense]